MAPYCQNPDEGANLELKYKLHYIIVHKGKKFNEGKV